MIFTAKVDAFEGPLDLLLHLIKINEVDITDIPIAIITEQYLEYLDLMRALDINVAGDFLVMASTLMHIKSKMLLPKPANDLEDIEDPREELIRPLIEYMQLKDVAEELSLRPLLNRDVFTRTIERKEIGEEKDTERTEITVFELMTAFKKIVKRQYPEVVLKFSAEKWSVKQKMLELKEILKQQKNIFLREVFAGMESLSEMITSFLALLELFRLGFVNIVQQPQDDDIKLLLAKKGG